MTVTAPREANESAPTAEPGSVRDQRQKDPGGCMPEGST